MKVAIKNAYKTQMTVGLPISLLCVLAVIGSQVMLQALNLEFTRGKDDHPFYWTYIPSFINVAFISIFGKFYRWLSFKLVY